MTTKDKALRLADELDGTVKTGYWEAAAELRRLHSVNADLLEALRGFDSAAQPAPVQDKCFLCGERVESCTSTVCPKATRPAAQPAPFVDLAAAIEYADARWSGVDVPIEWARHFADAICTPPAQSAVPDALTSADIEEHIEYVAGWNDCRQAMLEMMK